MEQSKSRNPLKIFLAVDGSEHSQAATTLLCDLPLPPASSITVLAVLTKRRTVSQTTLQVALDKTRSLLRDKGVEVKTGLLQGHPAEALTRLADEENPDLIVLGAKGLRATLGILLGGVAQQVVEYAHQPVLVVRLPYTGLRRVLLVNDGSAHGQQVVKYLTGFPLPRGTEVQVMHVLPPLMPPDYVVRPWPVGPEVIPPLPSREDEEIALQQAEAEEHEGQALLAESVEALKSSGVQATSILKRGDAATEIIEYAKANPIDLIAAGSRGLSQVRGWLLGSVSRKLLHYAGCSVLIVKGKPDMVK
jgi:nucleotide-binding universal stress UspA family protein